MNVAFPAPQISDRGNAEILESRLSPYVCSFTYSLDHLAQGTYGQVAQPLLALLTFFRRENSRNTKALH